MKKRKITGNPLKEFYADATKEVDGNAVTAKNFETKLAYALNSYHTIYDIKDCKKFLLNFFKYEKEIHEKLQTLDENTLHQFETFALNIKFLSESNLPVDVTPENEEYFKKKTNELLSLEKRRIDPEKAEERGYNIQKAIEEKAFQYTAKIDEYLDEYIFNKKKIEFNIVEFLKDSGLSNLHGRKLYNFYEKQKQEFIDIQTDAELREANKHLTDKRLKDIIRFYDDLLNDIDSFSKLLSQRKTQVRKPKKQSVEKLISKVKFCKESAELNVCSLNPSKIIGSNICIIYNERYKKLTIIYGKNMNIRGTSVVDYTNAKTKVLRNPKMFVSKFKECKKSEIDYLWKNIKTTETEGTGRIGENSIILNVF